MTATPFWWQRRWYAVALCCLMVVPLLWPDTPPLTDLPGHMGRYAVQIGRGDSPFLQRYYGFEWGLIGNLGLDLLIMPVAALIGLEPGVKLLVMLIPALTAGGLLWSAREAHGELPATAVFALPFAYGYPFQFGFVNFAMSMALTFLALGLWLRLGRLGRTRLRGGLFVAVGLIIWVCHSFGWAVLCLLVFAAELVRARDAGRGLIATVWHAGLACLPLAPPILLMLLWRSGAVAGETTVWFAWMFKLAWMLAALRNYSVLFDMASVGLVVLLLLLGLSRSGLRYNRMLGLGALFLGAAYILLPRILLGSAYADMRLAPYALAVAAIALRPGETSRWWRPTLAAAGLLFLSARLAVLTYHYVELDRGYAGQLRALRHIPRGARIMVMVNVPCQGAWAAPRMDHLSGLAIVRREAFVNGQWAMPGAQLLTIRHSAAGRFAGDPTQLLRPPHCRQSFEPVWEDTLRNFPRAAFDYFWLIDLPPSRWIKEPDLVPVWRGRTGILYRIVHSPVSRPATDPAPETRGASPTPAVTRTPRGG